MRVLNGLREVLRTDFFQVEGGLSWICMEGTDIICGTQYTELYTPILSSGKKSSTLSLASYPGLHTPAFASTANAVVSCPDPPWGLGTRLQMLGARRPGNEATCTSSPGQVIFDRNSVFRYSLK